MKKLFLSLFFGFSILACHSCGNATAETQHAPTIAQHLQSDSTRTPTLEQKIAALQSLQKDDLKRPNQTAQSKPNRHKKTQQAAVKQPEGVKLQRVSGNFTVSGNASPKE